MTYIVLAILNNFRPMWYYVISAVLFVLSQLDYFLLSKVIICRASEFFDSVCCAGLLFTFFFGGRGHPWVRVGVLGVAFGRI
jgi:hypothetical protein